jgi:hypothetical protein
VLGLGTELPAQAPPPRSPNAPPRNSLATNPFALLFGVASLEYQRATSDRLALAATGSLGATDLGTWGTLALLAFARTGAPRGPFLGPVVGYQMATGFGPDGEPRDRPTVVPVAGGTAGGNWYVARGAGSGLLVGVGVNVRAALRPLRYDFPPAPPSRPVFGSGRLAVGVAF